jgi:Pyridoxamine 5'-phosphate oxidase
MARSIATNRTVDLAELLDFARPRHRLLLATTRCDGRPQISPVSGGVDLHGRIVISTYPARAKTHNAKRDPRVSGVYQVNGGSDLVGDHLVGMRPGNVIANAFRAGFHLVAHRALPLPVGSSDRVVR